MKTEKALPVRHATGGKRPIIVLIWKTSIFDEDRFMSFCIKFRYMEVTLLAERNDTAEICRTDLQARRLFSSMVPVLATNESIDIRRGGSIEAVLLI
jgi:hypothetical protein